jgi:uncharacterized protein
VQLQTVLANFASPVLLFFLLGVLAARIRSDLAIPDAVTKALAIYLMMAIGFKGGVSLRTEGFGIDLLVTVVAAIILGAGLPVLAYLLLRTATRVGPVDAAAIAAHYGSVSIVTFLAATALLDREGIFWEGFLVAVLAVMESPAIVVGVLLARRAGARRTESGSLGEAFTNASVVMLLGSLAIGLLSGQAGEEQLAGFLVDPFQGVLALFLLDMGLVAARRLGDLWRLGLPLLAFGVYMPLIGGGIGLSLGVAVGLSPGGATLLGVLAASASYIAAPAAIRLVVPEANPSLYLPLALGVTFPFNIAFGIPIYLLVSQLLTGGP